jgi:hypothetical protein
MILVVCLPCKLAVRILPSVKESGELESLVGRLSEFWPDKYVCPRCEKGARGMLESEADVRALSLLEVRDLNAQEAFQAFMGLGFPDEQDCTLESLNELLREKPVRALHGENVRGSTRSVIESLELWDGTKIYFGAAPDGAVAYRVVRPSSAVARVERALTP